MTDSFDVVVLVGSLRKESTTRMIAHALVDVAPSNLGFDFVEFRDLPLYDQDLEANVPREWQAFRDRIRRADAILFATPEYNRSLPGGLKNAIDVGSRPAGQSAWSKKPAAIVSASTGALGGFGANHHLRQMLVFLDMPTLQMEAYISNAGKLLDDKGNVQQDSTKEFFAKIMKRFAEWIETVR